MRRLPRKATRHAAWTWTATASSGRCCRVDIWPASIAASARAPLNGPKAMGQHCPEGWVLHPLPGPNYKGATESASADTAYYNFVDRFDMLGLGKNVSLATWKRIRGAAGAHRRQVPDACACRIRWASTQKDSTAASTIHGVAGRARASGRPMRRVHRSMRKVARARRASW